MTRLRVAPSILAADFARLADEIARIPNADWIHVDVMDGVFVPNITLGPPVIEAVRRVTPLPLDVHLMIVEPDRHLEAFARAGSDRITVHAETCPHLHRTLARIRELGCRPGVAINPSTPPEAVEYVLGVADLVLVMSVNPGFGGQEFLEITIPKLRRLREIARRAGTDPEIEVDGGITPETGARCAAAGATVLVAGSSVFRADDPAAAVSALRERAAAACGVEAAG